MKNSKYRLDIIPGTGIFIFSIWYLLNIPGIPTFTGLGATPLTNHFVPYLWGGAMLVLSLWLIVRGMKKRKAYKAEGGVTQKNSMIAALVEKREVVVSFVALGLYVGLMGPIGFVPTTILYVFVQILVLTPGEHRKKNVLPAAITAIITGCLLFYIFRYMLNVLLPIGLLSIFGL